MTFTTWRSTEIYLAVLAATAPFMIPFLTSSSKKVFRMDDILVLLSES